MWYELGNNFEFNLEQLEQSREKLTDWLRSLSSTTGIPLEKTILAGFSQGGAMTLEVGLSLPLAGLIVLSGYLHPQQIAPAAPFPPVLMIHGTQDYVVPVSAARKSQERLLEWGVEVQYSEFPMGHEIPPGILPILREFMIHQSSLRDNDNS